MGTARCHLAPTMQGPGSYEARASDLLRGAPHIEKSCLWTLTVWGFASQVGRPDGGQWCLGEERLGQHYAGWHSPCVERRWLQKRSQLLLVRVVLLLQPSFQLHQALVHGRFRTGG